MNFIPDLETDWTEPGETQEESKQAPVMQAQDQSPEREAERPLPPQTIEIPNAVSTKPKPLPATIFVLNNGETVETLRYVLTASSVSLTVHREQWTIPLQMLDIDATLAANRDRGIDLQIPSDNNEVWLRF